MEIACSKHYYTYAARIEVRVAYVPLVAPAAVPSQTGGGVNAVTISLASIIIITRILDLLTSHIPNRPIQHGRHGGLDPIHELRVGHVSGSELEASLLANKRVPTWLERRNVLVFLEAAKPRYVILRALRNGGLAAALAGAVAADDIFRAGAD